MHVYINLDCLTYINDTYFKFLPAFLLWFTWCSFDIILPFTPSFSSDLFFQIALPLQKKMLTQCTSSIQGDNKTYLTSVEDCYSPLHCSLYVIYLFRSLFLSLFLSYKKSYKQEIHYAVRLVVLNVLLIWGPHIFDQLTDAIPLLPNSPIVEGQSISFKSTSDSTQM